jgi:hypothetical protein
MTLPESPRKPDAVFKFGRISLGLRVRQARSQCFGNLGILASYARDAGQESGESLDQASGVGDQVSR